MPAPAGTTANGLRKRVPGDQLAASSLGAPLIPRGRGGSAVAEKGDPIRRDGATDSGADAMFSLLSTFESGVQRGHSDFTRGSVPDDDDADREV